MNNKQQLSKYKTNTMNTRHLIIMALAVAAALAATARDRLYIDNLTIHAGETAQLSINLQNDTAYCAFQTDLYLPQGLEVAQDDGEYIIDLTSRTSRSQVVSTNRLADGAIRIYVPSTSGVTPFTGNSGAIAVVEVVATSDFSGSGTMALRHSVVVETNGDKHTLDDSEALAGEGGTPPPDPVMPGDVNGDKTINVGDYVATANYILMKDPQPFIFEAADIDGNGTINVGDLVAVANLALHYEGAPRMAAAVALPQSLSATMAAPRTVAVHTGGTAALQLDVTLPAGLTLAAASAGGHSTEVARLADGGWRVLVSSPAARDISGDVTLTLEGDGEGDAVLHGIITADTQGNTTAFGDIVLPIGTTGIGDIDADGLGDTTLYDLQGRRVVNPTPGIYVSKGRKIIVR